MNNFTPTVNNHFHLLLSFSFPYPWPLPLNTCNSTGNKAVFSLLRFMIKFPFPSGIFISISIPQLQRHSMDFTEAHLSPDCELSFPFHSCFCFRTPQPERLASLSYLLSIKIFVSISISVFISSFHFHFHPQLQINKVHFPFPFSTSVFISIPLRPKDL